MRGREFHQRMRWEQSRRTRTPPLAVADVYDLVTVTVAAVADTIVDHPIA
jgi:hypothetical protein